MVEKKEDMMLPSSRTLGTLGTLLVLAFFSGPFAWSFLDDIFGPLYGTISFGIACLCGLGAFVLGPYINAAEWEERGAR